MAEGGDSLCFSVVNVQLALTVARACRRAGGLGIDDPFAPYVLAVGGAFHDSFLRTADGAGVLVGGRIGAGRVLDQGLVGPHVVRFRDHIGARASGGGRSRAFDDRGSHGGCGETQRQGKAQREERDFCESDVSKHFLFLLDSLQPANHSGCKQHCRRNNPFRFPTHAGPRQDGLFPGCIRLENPYGLLVRPEGKKQCSSSSQNIAYHEGKINYFEKFFTSIYIVFLNYLHNCEIYIKNL